MTASTSSILCANACIYANEMKNMEHVCFVDLVKTCNMKAIAIVVVELHTQDR